MPSKTRIALLPLVLSSLAALSGCGRHASAAKTEDTSPPPIHVTTQAVTETDAPTSIRFTGSLKGTKETDLAANVRGRVTQTFVERGSEVVAGTILAQVDTSTAALSLAAAKVDLATTQTQDAINRSDCARFEQLKAHGAISDYEYDQTAAKCKTAALSIEAAQVRQRVASKNLGDGTIRAPFTGTVTERSVEVGEFLEEKSKVVSIAQIDELRLQLTLPEANVPSMKVGAQISFRVAAYGDESFKGEIKFVSGAVRPTTRDVVAEAVVPNVDRRLLPGMFADGELITGTQKLPMVPTEAIFERQEKKRVYVVEDGHLRERVLQVGPNVSGGVAVVAGVKVGENVAVGKVGQLTNGARVN